MTPSTAPPAPDRVRLPWRLTLAMFAACAGGELGEPARLIAVAALRQVEAAADRRDLRVALRGQLVLPMSLARSYPPLPLFRQRRRLQTQVATST